MDPDDDTASSPYYANSSSTTVSIYYANQKTSEMATVADIEDYLYSRKPNARVAVCTISATVRDIFIIDFN